MSTTTQPEPTETAQSAQVNTPNDTSHTALVRDVGERSEDTGSIAAFASTINFNAAQRMARALASSTVVPAEYRGERGIANCLVAMELASRTGASVLMVMQNLHVIDGKPSWSATFLVASVNSCGRFSPLRYQMEGNQSQAGWRCRAHATELATGEVLYGTWITWEMAKAEGWVLRKGSKWQTMPEQMIRYRAASFWSRVYAPEISLGMHTADEVEDFGPSRGPSERTASLNAALRELSTDPVAAVVTAPDPAATRYADLRARVERGQASEDEQEEFRGLGMDLGL